MRNCVDIVRPFTDAVGETFNVQVIGGIGSAALAHPETVIVSHEKSVIAPGDLFVPQYRDDGNLRDFDGLLMTSNQHVLNEARGIANEIIGNNLEISLFGLKPMSMVDDYRARPIATALKQFVSDRYVVMGDDGQVLEAQKVLFPFAVDMHQETLEPWQLFIGKNDSRPMSIPNPLSNIPNYLTRSVSGLRPRDDSKVGVMTDNLINQVPYTLDWLLDGPGSSQVELARILQRISRPGDLAVGRSLVISPAPGDLSEHSAFMIPEASEIVRNTVINLTQAKATTLHSLETNPNIVRLYQKYVEKKAAKIVYNEEFARLEAWPKNWELDMNAPTAATLLLVGLGAAAAVASGIRFSRRSR